VRITAPSALRLEPGRSSPEFGLVVPTTILVQDLAREAGREDVHGGWLLEPAADVAPVASPSPPSAEPAP
jgi:hypothetical protein